MKTKLTILVVAVLLFVFTIFFSKTDAFKPVTVFKSGTRIGSVNLSKVAWNKGYSKIENRLLTPFYIGLASKSKGVTPQELGITLDRDKLAKLTTTCKTSLFRLICVNTSNEKIDPNSVILVDREKLDNFLNDLDQEVAFLSENNVVITENFSFRALSPEAKVSVDKSVFSDPDSLAEIITTDNFLINLDVQSEDNKELQHQATKDLIEKISARLLIKYGGTPVYIPAETISESIGTYEDEGLLYGYVKADVINNYLESIKKDYESEDVQIITNAAINSIARAITFRAGDYEINNAVVLPLEGNPKTDGALHDEYLEIVKSQQRLYRFKHGSILKTYIISTGLTWDTPAGEYQVLGKQRMTLSYFGGWYMPNYLPIGTIDGYYFGFHEIPYHMDAAGNIYSRDPNTMGSPATGGCIQLSRKDSLELFDQIPVGTPVYIHE